MNVNALILAAASLFAVFIVIFGIFVPRFQRRDTAVALMSLHLSVLTTSLLLTRAEISAGLGLGLFGLLSILRLRSDEMSHEEMAYFLSALILGLIGGVAITPLWISPILMFSLIAALYLVGHPRFLHDRHVRTILLDRAIVDEPELRAVLDRVISGSITGINVRRVDMVNDSTLVQVRFRAGQTEKESDRPVDLIAVEKSSAPGPGSAGHHPASTGKDAVPLDQPVAGP